MTPPLDTGTDPRPATDEHRARQRLQRLLLMARDGQSIEEAVGLETDLFLQDIAAVALDPEPHPMTAPRDPIEAPATALHRLIHAVATDQDIYESEPELREIVDDALAAARDEGRQEAVRLIEAEPFFPNADGPTHGNAAAFRDYKRRIIENVARHGRSSDPEPAHTEGPQVRAALREAALRVLLAQEAVRDAINGQGHPDEPHDTVLGDLHRDPTAEVQIIDTVGDCALCGGMQYGSEDTLNRAYGELRAALGLEVRPWEYPEDAARWLSSLSRPSDEREP